MAFAITSACTNCFACEPLCPNKAISEAKPHFLIDAAQCTECEGEFEEPQCGAICPIEGAIIDANGEALNPPGSLTGIPLSPRGEARPAAVAAMARRNTS